MSNSVLIEYVSLVAQNADAVMPCQPIIDRTKKMAAVHSTTIPCELNTANRHEEKPYIFGKSTPVLTTLCVAGLVLLELFLCVFMNFYRDFVC